jgi:hypothetical protein
MAIDLDELERLAAQATPGPWVTEDLYNITHYDKAHEWHGIVIQADICGKMIPSEANVAYIVAACNSLPTLIAENRALQERVRELEIREVDYIEERDALLCTKNTLERQRDWLANRFSGEYDGKPASKYFLQLAEEAAKEAVE